MARCLEAKRIFSDHPYLDYPALVERAAMPAGVRITFRSDTASLGSHIHPVPEMSSIDLYCDGVFFPGMSSPAIIVLPAPGSSASRKRMQGALRK